MSLLLFAMCVVLEWKPTVLYVTYMISWTVMNSNIASYINDNQILYCHVEVHSSIILGHSYFTSPDYLVMPARISPTLLHPNSTVLAG